MARSVQKKYRTTGAGGSGRAPQPKPSQRPCAIVPRTKLISRTLLYVCKVHIVRVVWRVNRKRNGFMYVRGWRREWRALGHLNRAVDQAWTAFLRLCFPNKNFKVSKTMRCIAFGPPTHIGPVVVTAFVSAPNKSAKELGAFLKAPEHSNAHRPFGVFLPKLICIYFAPFPH